AISNSMKRSGRFRALGLILSAGSTALACHTGPLFSQGKTGDDHRADASPAAAECGAVATFADGKTPSRIRHVSIAGSDTAGDGPATRPFGTIATAPRGISPGTAICLHAGTHQGGTFLTGLQATEAQPVWIA